MVKFMNRSWRRRTSRAVSGGALVCGFVLAGGCSGTLDDVWPEREPAYKSSKSAAPLEVPPDLTKSSVRDTLPVPGVDATYSRYANGEEGGAARSESAVLPELGDAKIERSGERRWLVVAIRPEEAWPRIHDFWISQGFSIETEEPEIGVMETDWAEKHTPLPAGWIKRFLNTISDVVLRRGSA